MEQTSIGRRSLGQRSPGGKLAATLISLGLFGVFVGVVTNAAFSDTTSNNGSSTGAGTVDIDDNDGSTAMLSLDAAIPGDSDTSCIKVTFHGSLNSHVWLYGNTTGTGLDEYLDLTVTRGIFDPTEPAFDSCTNFSPDGTNYIGAGVGVIYNGTLQGFADSQGTAILDPTSGAPEVWTNGESHVYKFVVTLQSDSAAVGKNATQTFTWEARNI